MSLGKLPYNFWYFWMGEEAKFVLAQSELQNLTPRRKDIFSKQ